MTFQWSAQTAGKPSENAFITVGFFQYREWSIVVVSKFSIPSNRVL